MRIGIDARFYHPEAAGLARYASELVPRLLNLDGAKKHQFVVFLPENVSAIETTHPDTKFVHANVPHYSLAEQTKFKQILNDEKLDLVHYLHFNHPLFYKGRVMFTIHDLILSFYPGSRTSWIKKQAYEITIKHALKSATKLIAVTRTTKRQIVDHYGIDSEKIAVIYEAVDKRYQKIDNQKLITQVLKKYGIDKPYLIYVGQWREHKNMVRMLEAFAAVHARHRALQLVLVGKQDPQFPEVPETIKRLRLQKCVITTGFVPEDDLPVLYNGATAAIVPSLMEGFGLPPLEAMSCATPVVCSNASCLPEIVADAALFFDPESVVDMAEKITTIVTNPGAREIVRKAGLERVKEFSWDKMANETLALYETIK